MRLPHVKTIREIAFSPLKFFNLGWHLFTNNLKVFALGNCQFSFWSKMPPTFPLDPIFLRGDGFSYRSNHLPPRLPGTKQLYIPFYAGPTCTWCLWDVVAFFYSWFCHEIKLAAPNFHAWSLIGPFHFLFVKVCQELVVFVDVCYLLFNFSL